MRNCIFVNGNVVRDPALNTVGDNKVARFSVAVNTSKKGSDGQYASNFYEVSVWGRQADYVMNYIQKGTNVNIIGENILEEYQTKEGVNRVSMHINANDVQVCARGKNSSNDSTAKSSEDKKPAKSDLPF